VFRNRAGQRGDLPTHPLTSGDGPNPCSVRIRSRSATSVVLVAQISDARHIDHSVFIPEGSGPGIW
jgi:hypothetical protein